MRGAFRGSPGSAGIGGISPSNHTWPLPALEPFPDELGAVAAHSFAAYPPVAKA